MPSIRLTTVDPRELGRSWPRIFTRSNRVIRIGDFFFRFESQEIEKTNYENESGRNWIRGGVLSSLSFVSELFIAQRFFFDAIVGQEIFERKEPRIRSEVKLVRKLFLIIVNRKPLLWIPRFLMLPWDPFRD